jgi:hypothetical protein
MVGRIVAGDVLVGTAIPPPIEGYETEVTLQVVFAHFL